ncbi:HAMP domain-containing protein [Alphaproteobacteria bacterium GH1-50]|uniref:HAMP domain-containing protein n=1 Tax=Kangsaoukella pontilimi TaxID=2691042 RepID=A0A7C9MVG5_9RHOB|nr:methyl-accepting chemotaxis protein [Kangsaoukella pontilimi]MXQ06814.1 HAMP domain-containing protein [Kangsaoukella pontilimi]
MTAADGTVLVEVKSDQSTPADVIDQMIVAANSARDNGERDVSEDGFVRAKPIRSGDQVVGGIAIAWTAAPLLQRIASETAKKYQTAGLVFLVLTVAAGLFFRQALAVPLRRLSVRTRGLADGDLTSEVHGQKRRDEIGDIAAQLDLLRDQLTLAEAAAEEVRFKSAGFQQASVGLVMTDADLKITFTNTAFEALFERPELMALLSEKGETGLVGALLDPRRVDGSTIKSLPVPKGKPAATDICIGDQTFTVMMNAIAGADGQTSGFVMEWSDATEARVTSAVLHALEATQVRADFTGDGHLKATNAMLDKIAPEVRNGVGKTLLDEVLASSSGDVHNLQRSTATARFDKYRLGKDRLVSGILSPIVNSSGLPSGFVFLGNDITASEQARNEAEAARVQLEDAQQAVVQSLSQALNSLAEGNLSVRIESPFSQEYEDLRHHFNASVAAIESAVSVVRDNSTTILSEVENIAGAADDLSRRTEQQAATLEEFAASLTELTASVGATADGASQANEVVLTARTNAENSGSVVREAVTAMGEIAESSEQISRIIGLIDDIAFQTNLLALNAGVEAARAGDAGRGFAVVASEVRALAQRSSDAAREINELISASTGQVKKGVSLVDKAGNALGDIVSSIGNIADHVNSIASSAREQSIGIGEINTAMAQLDEATQQNVAMFEETTAATHTLKSESNALVRATSQFTLGDKAETGYFSSNRKAVGQKAPARKPAAAGALTDGALALAAADSAEDDWEDF